MAAQAEELSDLVAKFKLAAEAVSGRPAAAGRETSAKVVPLRGRMKGKTEGPKALAAAATGTDAAYGTFEEF
jgi:hypothetical protein